jgi:hypothetical protein
MAEAKTDEKKTMRGYLLGHLSDEEKTRVEERFLSDDVYFEQLSSSEEDLIEAYLQRELEKPDRERFEQFFMQSPVQRVRVERASVFLHALESAHRQKSSFASTAPRLQKVVRLRLNRRTFGFLLAAAALLMPATPCLLMQQQKRLRAQIEQSEAALQQERQLQRQLREEQKLAYVQIALLSQRLKKLRSPQLNSLILDVYPSRLVRAKEWATRSLRSAADALAPNQLMVQPGMETITLLLHSARRTVFRMYRLEIVDAKDSVIWRSDGLVRQPTGEYVVTIPSELLPPGGYSLNVYASNQPQRMPVEGYWIQIATGL